MKTTTRKPRTTNITTTQTTKMMTTKTTTAIEKEVVKAHCAKDKEDIDAFI